MVRPLSLSESGALAADHAASVLDHAADGSAFIAALNHNRRVWHALTRVARHHRWPVPDRRQMEFALAATAKPAVSDDEVHALVEINRRIAQALAAGELDRIRKRGLAQWKANGQAQGQALDHWLITTLENGGDGTVDSAA